MGYHVVDPRGVRPAADRPSEMRDIAEHIGLDEMGLRIYNVAPGEDIPLAGMHYHDEQEEAFYVVDGRLNVETPEETHQVDTGEFFVSKPRQPHRAFNDATAEENAVIVAVGAPAVSDAHPGTPESDE